MSLISPYLDSYFRSFWKCGTWQYLLLYTHFKRLCTGFPGREWKQGFSFLSTPVLMHGGLLYMAFCLHRNYGETPHSALQLYWNLPWNPVHSLLKAHTHNTVHELYQCLTFWLLHLEGKSVITDHKIQREVIYLPVNSSMKACSSYLVGFNETVVVRVCISQSPVSGIWFVLRISLLFQFLFHFSHKQFTSTEASLKNRHFWFCHRFFALPWNIERWHNSVWNQFFSVEVTGKLVVIKFEYKLSFWINGWNSIMAGIIGENSVSVIGSRIK